MDDNIQVGVRVRPLLEREIKSGRGSMWVIIGNSISQKGVSGSPYTFDHIFDKNVKTEVIFTTLAHPIIHSVMEGFNGTIFAYGQTSSGKTYTMTGNRVEPGIIPLTFHEVFNYIDQHPKREFIIAVSYMELYNEKLTDLLQPANKDLTIHEDSNHKVCVKGLTYIPVTTLEEIGHVLITGESNRSIGETTMNERSSRSHTVLGLTVESRCSREGEEDDDGKVRIATLNLVDLAGSERASVTGAEGIRFKEGTCINKSLLQLGIVISKLTEGTGTHIPFRDSKLTRILQSSLGGNTKTCIICAITPAEIAETQSTLKFASRAMKVQNTPTVNEVLVGEEAYKKMLKKYEKENEALKRKLEEGLSVQERQEFTQQLQQSEKQKADLEARIHSLEDIIVKSSTSVPDGTTKAQRRRTMCAGFPSYGVIPAVPEPLSTLKEATPVAQRRVTFASSPFVVRFDRTSFEKHLDLQDISPVQDRRRTRLLGRPSFIPRSSDDYLDDSDHEESTTSYILVDAQVQTEDAVAAHSSNDAECQTDTVVSPVSDVSNIQSLRWSVGQHTPVCVSIECQTDFKLLNLSQEVQQADASSGSQVKPRSCVNAMTQTGVVSIQHWSEASFCVHCQETRGPNGAMEQMETMQFESDERMQELQQSLEEVEHLLAVKEAEVQEAAVKRDAMAKKVGDLEMANQAQEELLVTLQSRLKEKNIKLQQVNQQLEQALHESEEKSAAQQAAASELTEMKDKLLVLQQKLQKSTPPHPQDSAAADSQLKLKNAELATKLAEAQRMRKEDDLRFQKSYEHMALQTQKARERACALEEMIETLEQQAASEEAKLRTSLEEKTRLTESLREECSTTKLQLHSLSTEYEEYVTRMEGTVQHLQQQLATSEMDSAAVDSHLRLKTAELTAKLAESERMRKEDDMRFQKSYEQMSLDVQKAHERASALDQQLAAQEEQAASEDTKLRASLEEKTQLIRSLREECTTTKLQLQLLSTEHERMSLDIQKARERACALEKQLATQEQQAASEEAKLRTSLKEKTQLIQSLREESASEEAKLRASLEDKSQLIQSLREQSASEKAKLRISLEEKSQLIQSLREESASEEAKLRDSLEEKAQIIHSLRDQSASEETKLRTSLEEKSRLTESLREECTTTKQQLQSVSTEYQEYAARMERRVRHLKQQLATSEQDSAAVDSQLKLKNAELTAKLAEAERLRKEDDLKFQKSCEKARERASVLEQQIAKQQEQADEMRVTLGERIQEIKSLREQCTTTKHQLQSVSTQYQEYATRMEGSVSDLQRQLATSEQQLKKLETECKSSSAAEVLEQQLRDLRKENAQLMTKIQHQAVRTSESTSVVTDGSGFVTGLALHQIRHEKQLLERQNDQLRSRVQKLKDEFTAEREKLNGVREDVKRYRHERNVFRAKYQCLKADCKCGALNLDHQDDLSSNPAQPPSTSTSTSASTSSTLQPSTNSVPLEKLPSPKPPRRSILSFNPDRDLQSGRRPFASAAPLAEPVIPKPKHDEPEYVKPLEPPLRKGLQGHHKFVWEDALLETSVEAKAEPQNCQQQ